MVDEHTRKTLDAMADLFLTDTAGSAQGHQSAPQEEHEQNASLINKHLDSPVPIRLRPKPAHVTAPLPPESSDDREGVAGVIGIDDTRAVLDKVHSLSQSQQVEAVLMGHLPGYAAPWLTQYAHHLSQRQGPVGILHVDEDQIEVELISTVDKVDPTASSDHPLQCDPATHNEPLLDCLHDLSQLTPSPVKTWLVHLPTTPTPAMLARVLQLPQWTLLCGANEAAISAAGPLLDRLLTHDPHRDQRRVTLWIMGSDESVGLVASRKLNATAESFLANPIVMGGHLKQMVPVNRRCIGNFAGTDKLWPSVQALFETIHGQMLPLDAITEAQQGNSDNSIELDEPEDFQKMVEDTPVQSPTTASDPFYRQFEVQTERPDQAQLGPNVHTETLSTGLHEQMDSISTDLPASEPASSRNQAIQENQRNNSDLGQHLPGIIALPVRCPRHRHIQIVLDESGQLHLLRRCVEGDNGPGPKTVQSAVVDLIETRAWASEHIEMLQQTQRQCRFDPQAQPVLHLFTDQAKAAVQLAGRTDRFLRLHLLQEIATGGNRKWISTELN